MSLLSADFEVGSSSKGTIGFPESFQRTTVGPQEDQDAMSEASSPPSPSSEVNSLSFPRAPSPIPNPAPEPSFRRVSRSSVMRLENILNDVSINHIPSPRSRSLGRSPVESYLNIFTSSSSPESVQLTRSESPDESPVRKKKVKMHRCPECQKDFPRPSGLRTHMNMHTKEKPFGCTYPGCTRTFSVVSNAKRHMRTHGLGISADDADQPSVPYVVGFEAPMIVEQPGIDTRRGQPFRLRWIALDSDPKVSGRISTSPPNLEKADSLASEPLEVNPGTMSSGKRMSVSDG